MPFPMGKSWKRWIWGLSHTAAQKLRLRKKSSPSPSQSLPAHIFGLVALHLEFHDISSLSRTNKAIRDQVQPVMKEGAFSTIGPITSTPFQSDPPPNRSMVHFAAAHGNLSLMREILCRLGDDKHLLDAADDYGHTPLISAVIWGNLSVAQALLAAGADIECTTKACGWSPLHCAALYGNLEAAQLLVTAGANTSRKDTLGSFTPLHLAAFSLGVVPSIFPDFKKLGWDSTAVDDFGISADQTHAMMATLLITPSSLRLRRRGVLRRKVSDHSTYMFMYEIDRCRWCPPDCRQCTLTDISSWRSQVAATLLNLGETEADMEKRENYEQRMVRKYREVVRE